MLVLHSLWDMNAFRVWAESSMLPLAAAGTSGNSTGEHPKPHPFSLPGGVLSDGLSAIFNQAGARIEALSLRLPSVSSGPLPSPWLLRDDYMPEKATFLQYWTIEALAYHPAHALAPLLGLPLHPPQGTAFADSMRFWSGLAMFSLELVGREQFVPCVRCGKAFWRAVIDEADAERLMVFSESMPPSCMGYLPADESEPAPHILVKSFVDCAVDAFVRKSLNDVKLLPSRRGRKPRAVPPAQQFLEALTSQKALLNLSSEELKSFATEMASWTSQLLPSAEEVPFRTCFRLEPPSQREESWTIHFFLQARDDRSLLVPAEDVWKAKSDALPFLKKRLKNPQEQLLADLGRAMRVFPQIERSLEKALPVGLVMETDEAYSFLRNSAPLLEQNGFGILLPA